jgi:hypothetical protein
MGFYSSASSEIDVENAQATGRFNLAGSTCRKAFGLARCAACEAIGDR